MVSGTEEAGPAQACEAAPERASRGVRFIECDVRLSGLSIQLAPDGTPSRDAGQATLELRTDMWPFWLREAIEAAVVANEAADEIGPRYERFKKGEATDADLDELVICEMIATMRAIGGAAFAIDALYAAVKERSPKHPHQATWREKGTARHKQVTETFFYHLKIKNQTTKKAIRHWVSQIYKFRDLAVHSPSEFSPAQYRADLEVGLDQCFIRFRRENAITATAMAVSLIDYLVSFLQNGSAELAEQKQGARRKMDVLLDRYESAGVFPTVARREPPLDDHSASPATAN
jgi:hypothetical protein